MDEGHPDPSRLGPVSEALALRLDHSLRGPKGIVLWCDPDGRWFDFVAARPTHHPTVVFAGSWLAFLRDLGAHPEGNDPQPLLLYVPGFDLGGLDDTPAFPLTRLASLFAPDLPALVRDRAAGRVTPAEIADFLAGPDGRSLAAADRWLGALHTAQEAAHKAVYERVTPDVLLDDLIARVAHQEPKLPGLSLAAEADHQALARHLHRALGMDAAWRAFCRPFRPTVGSTGEVERLLLDVVAWVLAVEYVDDLRRPPYLAALAPLGALPPALVATCRGLAEHLRSRHAAQYPSLADEVEEMLREGELGLRQADDLGQVDTFRGEEQRLLKAAVEALGKGLWTEALSLAGGRLESGRSFWLHQAEEASLARRWLWTLVQKAARLGVALDPEVTGPFWKTASLDDVAARYTRDWSPVDLAHRQFEQDVLARLDPRMEHYGALQEVVVRLRERYRRWADALAGAFARRCVAEGFLPSPSLQQRNLYEQVVQPRVEQGQRVALFLVDALRYEMATELQGRLVGDGRQTELRHRLAELPTLTSVGMNALCPVARDGRLRVAGPDGTWGFRAGEFVVSRPEDRARAIGQRSLGKTTALLLNLAEVCAASPDKDLQKRVAQRKVIVVQSREIDDAGESNVGLRTFDSVLNDLKTAWHLLHDAGVDVAVFTADHGFLLQDSTTQVVPYGNAREPKRRHVLDPNVRDAPGLVSVPVAALGYDGLEGHLVFRTDTAVFAHGNPGASFVHGGNSLQERVIPVLVVEAPRGHADSAQTHTVTAEVLPAMMGLARVRLGLVRDRREGLDLGDVAALDVAARVVGRDDLRVDLRYVTAPGVLEGGRITLPLPLTDDGVECLFAVLGVGDARVQVEFFHPDNPRKVKAAVPGHWFDVTAGGVPAEPAAKKPAGARGVEAAPAWSEAIADPGVRKVFLHLAAHGSITEPEATQMLGSPRAFRRFSADFETYPVPFRVQVVQGPDGKQFWREGGA